MWGLDPQNALPPVTPNLEGDSRTGLNSGQSRKAGDAGVCDTWENIATLQFIHTKETNTGLGHLALLEPCSSVWTYSMSWLEMQNLSPSPHPLNQNLLFNEVPRWFVHMLKLGSIALEF